MGVIKIAISWYDIPEAGSDGSKQTGNKDQ
jgi:hypothetical protein